MKTIFNLEYINQKLNEAKYESALGIRLSRLATTIVSGKEMTLIAVRLDPGKQLVPHLHEVDGEICFPLTKGVLTLGKTQRSENGDYKIDSDEKIVVTWLKPQTLIPGRSIEILPGVAHHLLAPKNKSVTVLFFLPTTHLSEDRKFVTNP